MVNNQEWFDNNHQNKKEVKEIELKYKKFQGQLIVENYPELEKLHLQNIKNIDKIVLKNLENLEECTIWGCGTKDLIVENCPQIKKLNIRTNLLTNLDFLKDLENLEELEIDGNDKLTEILKFYQSDWKTYQEIFFKLATKQDFQGLADKFWDLKKKYENLKKKVLVLTNRSTSDKIMNTKEIVFNLGEEFKKKEEKISRLELRVRELTELSEKQRQKIQTYLESFGSEQESIRKLIIEYLNYIKFKNEADTDDDFEKLQEYEECYQKIQNELKNKLEKKDMIKVKRILADCEKLFEREQDIGKKLGDSKTLLNEGKGEISKMPDSKERDAGIRKIEEKEGEINEKLKTHQEQPIIQQFFISGVNSLAIGSHASFTHTQSITIQYNYEKSKKELDNVVKKYQELEIVSENQDKPLSKMTQVEKIKLKKSILFLGTKQNFATTRQETINNLKEKYNKLEGLNQKYEKLITTSDVIKNIGEVVNDINAIGGTVVKLLAKGVSVATNILKNNSSVEQTKEFEDYLIKDEAAMTLLNKTYQSLVETIQGNEKKLNPIINEILKRSGNQFSSFEEKYNVFEVSSIKREDVSLSAEQMKQALEALVNNLEEFKKDFQKEAEQCAREMEISFNEEDGNLLQAEFTELLKKLTGKESSNSQEPIINNQQKDLQSKIKAEEAYLQELVANIKNKLKSECLLFSEKRNKERETMINDLLNMQIEITRSGDTTDRQRKITSLQKELLEVANEHGHKEFKTELDNLCQVQVELTKSELALENLKNQQSQIQIPPKGNN
jgi:hypothetical protein